MKVYVVYLQGSQQNTHWSIDIKVYKNEEDAKNFVKNQGLTADFGRYEYKELQAEGFDC